MMLIRFFLYLLLIYLVYRFLRNVLSPSGRPGDRSPSRPDADSETKQQGRPGIDEADIEDADFEEIDENKT